MLGISITVGLCILTLVLCRVAIKADEEKREAKFGLALGGCMLCFFLLFLMALLSIISVFAQPANSTDSIEQSNISIEEE